MNPEERERVAKALADARRWRILELARGRPGISCGEVTADLGVSQPTASHHIAALVEAGLLSMEKEGTMHRLSVVETTLARYAASLSPIATTPGPNG